MAAPWPPKYESTFYSDYFELPAAMLWYRLHWGRYPVKRTGNSFMRPQDSKNMAGVPASSTREEVDDGINSLRSPGQGKTHASAV